MPRWLQCPQLGTEPWAGLRFHLLNGATFSHLRGLCVTVQRSECFWEKDDCLSCHRQEHWRKVLEMLLPSGSLSDQGRGEANDVQRQRCQDSRVTAQTQVWMTFRSWPPPRALSTVKRLSSPPPPCCAVVQGTASKGPRASVGETQMISAAAPGANGSRLAALWEGLWLGEGEAGRGRQGRAARTLRKSSPLSEASDSAP